MKDPELKYWTSPPNGFLVATTNYNDEKVVGCISYKSLSESTLELNRLSVNRDHRGLGIGIKLVNALIQIAKDQGYENVYLETTDIQVSACRLYEKIGFKFVKIIPPSLDYLSVIHGVCIKTYNYKLQQ